MKKIVLFVLTAALAAGAVSAETITLTVDQAVELARDQNLGLKQSAIALQTKERADRTSWNQLLPGVAASVDFSASHYGVFEHDIDFSSGFGDAGNLGVSGGLNLSLPLNSGLGAGIKTLKSDYEAGLLDYEEAGKQLDLNVRTQFYGLIANEESIRIQEDDLELYRKRLEQARNNYANGLVPELEVLSAEVAVANQQPAVLDAKAQYESQVLGFLFTLGLPLDTEIELTGDLETELYDLDADELIRKYMAGRLDIRKLDQEITTLVLSKRGLNLSLNTPTLNLGYTWGISGTNGTTATGVAPIINPEDLSVIGYGTSYSNIDPWTDFGDFGTLSIGLQWKLDGLIPGSSTDVQLREMQDGIDSLMLARQMAWDNAVMEITDAVNKLETAAENIEAATSSVELARRNYELTEEAYEVGTRELLDVDTQQQAYSLASFQLLMNKFEYISRMLELEYALNTPKDVFLK